MYFPPLRPARRRLFAPPCPSFALSSPPPPSFPLPDSALTEWLRGAGNKDLAILHICRALLKGFVNDRRPNPARSAHAVGPCDDRPRRGQDRPAALFDRSFRRRRRC